jgi:hypothetical protein
MVPMGTAVRPAKTSPGPWDAFADVDVFVDEVLSERTAMARDGSRPLRSVPKPPMTGAMLRKAAMAIWCVCFCGIGIIRTRERRASYHPWTARVQRLNWAHSQITRGLTPNVAAEPWRDLSCQDHSDKSAKRLSVEPAANKQYMCILFAHSYCQ